MDPIKSKNSLKQKCLADDIMQSARHFHEDSAKQNWNNFFSEKFYFNSADGFLQKLKLDQKYSGNPHWAQTLNGNKFASIKNSSLLTPNKQQTRIWNIKLGPCYIVWKSYSYEIIFVNWVLHVECNLAGGYPHQMDGRHR